MVHPQQHRLWHPVTCIIALVIVVALSACQSASTPAPHDCGTPTLTVGNATFSIRAFRPSAGSFLGVPSASPKVAFWIAGTEAHLAFVISADAENLRLEKSLLKSVAGQSATVTWADCSASTYRLSAVEQVASGDAALPDESAPGITIFFQQDSSGSLSVVRGVAAGQEAVAVDTLAAQGNGSGSSAAPTAAMPAAATQGALPNVSQLPTSNVPTPDSNSLQAEISLLDTVASADGAAVQVSVSILNTGRSSFTLAAQNVTLTAQDATSARLLGSEPGLPQSFGPGEPKTITLTFAKPSSPTATLKIFDVEYDIDGY